MLYIYEGHLYGNLYVTDKQQKYKDLYCEQCGDSDWFVGAYDNPRDFLREYSADIHLDDDVCDGIDFQDIMRDIVSRFEDDTLTEEEAYKIVYDCQEYYRNIQNEIDDDWDEIDDR